MRALQTQMVRSAQFMTPADTADPRAQKKTLAAILNRHERFACGCRSLSEDYSSPAVSFMAFVPRAPHKP
ncbi:hypothetical protein RB1778 [Rhodopirellula baltica SH 1]|uniref:Uncharacterized protein n=1 Tax=Rhodopirellula baltica (strain DSM 10527 / NCIMB 13988 / SH1) TaxID=243090 RepID=Q7UWU8_RHOBA|nr:hypothetical protein RB1778 [Rhodopirellula baltica SH 1]